MPEMQTTTEQDESFERLRAQVREQDERERLRALSDDELEAVAEPARAEIERARQLIETRSAEAQHAADTFKFSPSATTASARDVSAQLFENAKTEYADTAERHRLVHTEATRRKRLRRYEELLAHPLPARLEPIAEAVVAAYEALMARLRVAAGELERQLAEHNPIARELTALDRDFGAGTIYGTVPMVEGFAMLNAVLEQRLGGHGEAFGNLGQGARIHYSDGYAEPFVGVQLRFPYKPGNPTVR